MIHDPTQLPDDLPVPEDDGAANHLPGLQLPPISLPATDGSRVDLSSLNGTVVVYVYPRTGVPGQPLPEGWDAIPGARGCTPQSCAFRDHYDDLVADGVQAVFGLSTQSVAEQREARDRLHLPYELLSDRELHFARALKLPTFEVSGMTLIKRMTLILRDGHIRHALYPVFPPDRNAADVLAWLRQNAATA